MLHATMVASILLCQVSPLLTVDEEQLIREAIYKGEIVFRSPPRQPLESMLVVPKAIGKVYKTKPRGSSEVLLKIVDGGSPRDSVFAAACLVALLESPEVAVVVVRGFEAKSYDKLDRDWEETPRQHWLGVVVKMRNNKLNLPKRSDGKQK